MAEHYQISGKLTVDQLAWVVSRIRDGNPDGAWLNFSWRRVAPPYVPTPLQTSLENYGAQIKMPELGDRLAASAAYLNKEECSKGLTVTILDAGTFEQTQRGKTQLVLSVQVGKEKRKLGLSPTAEKALAAAFGSNSDKWVGKKVKVTWGKIGNAEGRVVSPA